MGLAVLVVPISYPTGCVLRDGECRPSCISNLKQLGTAMLAYCQDYDDHYPPAGSWCDAVDPYIKHSPVHVCPARAEVPFGYAYNRFLERRPLNRIQTPTEQPGIFESWRGVRNEADGVETFVRPHSGGGNVGFADGHVKYFVNPPAADAGLLSAERRRVIERRATLRRGGRG